MTSFNIILSDGFETLDAFGPAEVIGQLREKRYLRRHSLDGGIIKSSQQVSADALPFGEVESSGVLLIPGGMGQEL